MKHAEQQPLSRGLVDELRFMSSIFRDLEETGRSLDEEIAITGQRLEEATHRLAVLRELRAMLYGSEGS